MSVNPLLLTDVYKMGHMEQYKPGITKVYSTLVARKDNMYTHCIPFGLQYYLKKYFKQRITQENVDEFLEIRKSVLGTDANSEIIHKLRNLVNVGYFPLLIKSVPEGYRVRNKNVILTLTNTSSRFFWVPGFVESLLLKVWNTYTVATKSFELRLFMEKLARETCSNNNLVPYQVHDFGYRGCSSEETAALSGAAHLTSFLGTDTIPAIKLLKDYYYAEGTIGLSVPASEHSVMCSFGPDNEIEAFEHMLETYPGGIVSIVSDTYNLWNVLTNITPKLKEKILSRTGKVVFRPDSGDQTKILCGDPRSTEECEKKGVFRLLGEQFGTLKNYKGYEELHPSVGVIYGDGFHRKKLEETFHMMKTIGWASSNLVVGIGGILLQNNSRDDMGFSLKATYVEENGSGVNIYKDPITDPGKKSFKGLCRLDEISGGHGYSQTTTDEVSREEELKGILKPVYYFHSIDEKPIINEVTLKDIRTGVLLELDRLLYTN